MCSCFLLFLDLLLMHQEVESTSFYVLVYSAFGQTWSFKTRWEVLETLRFNGETRLPFSSKEKDDLMIVMTPSGEIFSIDRKYFFKSFRLDRQDRDPMVLLRHLSVLFVEKVSRMDHVVTCNTSSTDDRIVNCRKSGKSPFLSKERDEKVTKVRVRVEKNSIGIDLVALRLHYGINLPVVSKNAQNSVDSCLGLLRARNLNIFLLLESFDLFLVWNIRFY